MLITHAWLSLGICIASASARPGMGTWLIDLGRDYPLTRQAGVSDADAALTLLFMEAAARIEPELPASYYWQYDMLTALDRPAEARRALAAYVRREPADASAQLEWIAAAIDTLHTAEQRAEFCAAYLKHDRLSPAAVSDLRRRLAEYHWNRADLSRAAQEAEAALQADVFNLRARELLDEIRGRTADPTAQVEHYLWALRVNPASAQAAADLAIFLADLSQHQEAERFFAHATRLLEALPPGHAPASLLLRRADALADAGRPDEAQTWIDQAAQHARGDVQVLLARVRLAGRRGDLAAAQSAMDQVTVEWRSRMSAGKGGLDPHTLADVSWVLIHVLGNAEQAAALARPLLHDSSARPVAQRALGAALIRQQQWAQAAEVLATTAARDTWSAILLTAAMEKLGRTGEAARQIAALATQPAGSEQRGRIHELAAALKVPVPATQPVAGLAQALERFPGAVLDFPFQPEKHIEASWSIEPQRPVGADPWLCTLTLKNIGTFPIVIGRDAMLSPEILCSIQLAGDRTITSGPSLRTVLQGPLKLEPGESIRVSRNLFIGPARAAAIWTPQVTQSIELTALTNPMRLVDQEGHDVWAPAPGGMLLPPLRFERAGIVAVPDEVRRIMAVSASGDADQRVEALSQLAMLLGEHQHLAARRLNYAVPRIDAEKVQNAVLARATDGDWRVRAHFAEVSRWFVLDKTGSQAVTRLLGDSHWLVRGLAARCLTDQKGDKARPVLEYLSEKDGDDWVRRFSAALLQRTRTQAPPAATAPAAAAPVRPSEPRVDVAAPATPPQPLLLALPEEAPSTAPARP